jgi:hypothetical protein
VDTGNDFLRSQVNNAIMQHKSLVENIEGHSKQAEDPRFSELCRRYVPRLQAHQRMLEDYGRTIGAEGGGTMKKALGDVLGKARETVDAFREDDFLRLVGDIVMIRQAQDTFATFASVGELIGEPRLADIGHECANDHDTMQREFNSLVRDMFVEQMRGGVDSGRATRTQSEARP